ncbi:MAG: thiamine pyrophosphate-binding protein [Promethearchaeota archaeon]
MAQENKTLSGGDVLVKCLLEENVRYIFGIIGGQLLPIYDAIYRWGREEGIHTVMFRHEQAAAHAADAWARVTNSPGVCMGTVGPGALHLIPAIGAAWADNIPVIAIVPQLTKDNEDSFDLQGNLDQISLFKPITKYQRSVLKIEKIPDAVHKAYRHATGGRPQPVLLEFFTDAMFDRIEESKIKNLITAPEQYRAIGYPSVSNNLVNKALDMLVKAEKPLIVAGGGVQRAEAWEELQQFAEHLEIPVVTTIMGIGSISNQSKCSVGRNACTEADVILALGCKFSHTMGLGKPPLWNDGQTLIQVDIDPIIIGRAKPVSLGIVSDCKNFLEAILKEGKKLNKVENRSWLISLTENMRSYKESLLSMTKDDSLPINPLRMAYDVLNFMDEDAILVMDGGNIVGSTIAQFGIHKPRPPLSTLIAIGMGHLGTSVPYGIGAKLAKPDKQVVTISGDGSFMINIQDLETAVRLGLKNLIYVVANNSTWGMIKTAQQSSLESRFIDVDLPEHLNYGKIAEAMGCYGEKITDPKEITPALIRAKNSGLPAVLDIKTRF